MNITTNQIKAKTDIYHPGSKNVWRIDTVVIGGVQHYHAYSRVDNSPFLTEPVTAECMCAHLNANGFMLAATR